MERRSLDALVKKSFEVRNRFIGVEKLLTIVMQDAPEHVSCDRSDFLRVFSLCKGLLNGLNDLSFFFGTKEIVKASQEGDVPERHGPSHFLDQRDVRLPLQERAQVLCHALSWIPLVPIPDSVFRIVTAASLFMQPGRARKNPLVCSSDAFYLRTRERARIEFGPSEKRIG